MSAATTMAPKRAQLSGRSFVTRRPSVRAAAATLGYLLSVVAVNIAAVAWLPMLVTRLLWIGPYTRARGNITLPRDPAHHRSSRHRAVTR